MTETLPLTGPAPARDLAGHERLRETAQEFEAVFISQMLRALTEGVEGEGPLGGGEGDPFRGLLGDEIGKLISRSGGVGVADGILKEMLRMQEVA
jgi:peptidoglycan hydrolase FlgJ